ncbi:MAG: type II secretion system protein GspC [Tahibacter sp.]
MSNWSSTDIDRASRYGAFGSCALAGLLCLSLAVKLLWLAVPRGDVAVNAAASAAAAVVAPVAVSVSKWHIFGTSNIGLSDIARRAPATQLQMVLRGTLAEPDPTIGMAVIFEAGAGERAYRVGEDLPGGARLDAVYPDRVVILHEGVQETLALPFDQPSAPVTAASAPLVASPGGVASPLRVPPPALPAGNAPVTFIPPQMANGAVDFSKIQQQLNADPAALARQFNALPVFENGKMTGVRLTGGPDAALIGKLGLQPTDVVTSINSIPLDSPTRMQQVIDTMKNANRVTVTINRDGKPTTLSVNVQ